jgi:hypothetical protein
VVDKSGTEAAFLRVLRFPLPILIPLTPPHSSSIIRSQYNRPVSGRRTKWTQSHPTPRNRKNKKERLLRNELLRLSFQIMAMKFFRSNNMKENLRANLNDFLSSVSLFYLRRSMQSGRICRFSNTDALSNSLSFHTNGRYPWLQHVVGGYKHRYSCSFSDLIQVNHTWYRSETFSGICKAEDQGILLHSVKLLLKFVIF